MGHRGGWERRTRFLKYNGASTLQLRPGVHCQVLKSQQFRASVRPCQRAPMTTAPTYKHQVTATQ